MYKNRNFPILLVGTPSAIRPELAFRRALHSLPNHHLCCMCIDFYDLSAWAGCWFVVYIRRFIYKLLNLFFWLHGCCDEWEGWASKPVNHTSRVVIVTPTDRPKSIRNRGVIEFLLHYNYWHYQAAQVSSRQYFLGFLWWGFSTDRRHSNGNKLYPSPS